MTDKERRVTTPAAMQQASQPVRAGMPEYYEDHAGEMRWRVRAKNGEIIAASSEGFENTLIAMKNYDLVKETMIRGSQESADENAGGEGEEGNDQDGSSGSGGLSPDGGFAQDPLEGQRDSDSEDEEHSEAEGEE